MLASKYFDRHTSYVALSRHRESATLFYAQDEFASPKGEGGPDPVEAKSQFEYTLSRARPKELAHDYLEPSFGDQPPSAAEEQDNPLQAIQTQAREAWATARANDLKSGATPEEIQRLAREHWQDYRQGQGTTRDAPDIEKSNTQEHDRGQGKDDGL